jgi:predicted lipoprotein with Yx(FWY)xxD motif
LFGALAVSNLDTTKFNNLTMTKMNTISKTQKFLNGRWARLFGLLIAFALVLPFTSKVYGQGNPVSIAVNNQINPVMTTDGSGGTIISWQDKRNGKYEIFAQRMNGDGNAMWTTDGIAICTQDSNSVPVIVSDGSGGAIIAWQSYRGSATADIYAQRVNSSGAVQWTTNGQPVCVVVFEQDTIAMVSDGLGGVILTWQDYRSNNGFADIYAQRIDPAGTMIWTANGVNICNQAAAQRGPKIVSDGSGGAFITWYDNRAGNYDIYTQRIGSAGAVQWTTNGVATCTAAADQMKPDICSDGAAGVIVTWYDYRSTTDFNIYAQRVGPGGAIVWVVDGVVMNNNVAYDQIDPKIVSDGMGGAIISWTDYRTGTTADIYAQRVNSTGAVQWTATGIIICTASGDQIKSQLVSDGNSGAYITWEDHRNVGNSDIYAQRIASNAAINWAATGYAICTAGNDQLNPMIVSNGNLGAIVAWQDYRSGSNFDIYETGFNTTGVIAIENNGTGIPHDFSLSQNYPNPFNPMTTINYQLPEASFVNISIFDALGREVSVLVNQTQNAGYHKTVWNAMAYPSGVYFYRIEAGSYVTDKKMILVK